MVPPGRRDSASPFASTSGSVPNLASLTGRSSRRDTTTAMFRHVRLTKIATGFIVALQEQSRPQCPSASASTELTASSSPSWRILVARREPLRRYHCERNSCCLRCHDEIKTQITKTRTKDERNVAHTSFANTARTLSGCNHMSSNQLNCMLCVEPSARARDLGKPQETNNRRTSDSEFTPVVTP